jgi:hypothetical protein
MKRSIFSCFSLALILCINTLSAAQKTTLESPDVQVSQRTELARGTWIKQEAQTANYIFEVFVLPGENSPEFREWRNIRVIDRHTGRLIQLINANGGGVIFPSPDKLVNLVDFNFDGQLDLRVQTADGGASPNDLANFYAFDKKNNRFVFDKELSEMTQVFINVKNKTISSAYRDGCCHHHEDRYVYQAGRRLHVYEWDEAITADNWLETSVGRLTNGKMHYKLKRVKQRHQ